MFLRAHVKVERVKKISEIADKVQYGQTDIKRISGVVLKQWFSLQKCYMSLLSINKYSGQFFSCVCFEFVGVDWMYVCVCVCICVLRVCVCVYVWMCVCVYECAYLCFVCMCRHCLVLVNVCFDYFFLIFINH